MADKPNFGKQLAGGGSSNGQAAPQKQEAPAAKPAPSKVAFTSIPKKK